jgi:2-polyprenyl-3-methyl-5-hydroxy-6-metoxy-1,4-benzoquinol methylase
MSFIPKKNKRWSAQDTYGIIHELASNGWMHPGGVGSDHEPWNTKWCEALSSGVGDKFKEGLCIIDWGCGYARYYNWLTSFFDNFTYYGFEVHGPKNGDLLVNFCRQKLSDPRCTYDYIDSDTVDTAITKCNVVLLGSVFTHISIKDADGIVKRFSKLLDKGGSLVFSVIIADNYSIGTPAYGVEGSYDEVQHRRDQIETLARDNNCELREASHYQTNHTYVHTIFEMKRLSN